jgi:cytochrome c5
MFRPLLFICFMALAATPAWAGQPEAREVARLNNCVPKKIEVFQNQLGAEGKTVYQVTCNLPKTAGQDDSKNGPDALLIGCAQSLCELIRPVASEKK